jgi:chitinase
MVGGNGADLFVFTQGAIGHDTVQDFSKAEGDKLEFHGTGLSAAQILASGTQSGTDLVLHLGSSDITLIGVTATDLSGMILSY